MYEIYRVMVVYQNRLQLYQMHLIVSDIEVIRKELKSLISCERINFIYGEKEN